MEAEVETITPRLDAVVKRRPRHFAASASSQAEAGHKRKRDGKRLGGPVSKYTRGDRVNLKGMRDKKLRHKLKNKEQDFSLAALKAAKSEILLPAEPGFLRAEGMEKTFKFNQHELVKHVDAQSARKVFDLKLEPFAPYRIDYTRNGRHMLFGGKKGHVAVLDWPRNKLVTEFQVKETVKDVAFLQNHTMFAVAQKKYTYIYDQKGIELHRLKNFISVERLEFLPYHWLLVSVGDAGWVKWLDTSTGTLVAEHRTKLGPCSTMTHNPQNAVTHLGHAGGTVTLWSPNMSQPLVKMLCHAGPVKGLAIDPAGTRLATSGLDGRLKIWDLRNFKLIDNYFTLTPASSLCSSQLGLLSVGFGPHVQIWKDIWHSKQNSPYMTHLIGGSTVADTAFCPFEDVLGIGHSLGVSSILIPGSGQPNYDSFEADPFQSKKQRTEAEIHSLLEKLRPEMIALDPNVIATVDRASKETIEAEKKAALDEKLKAVQSTPQEKGKTKRRKRKYKKKQDNVWDQKRMELQEKAQKKKEQEQSAKEPVSTESVALDRFLKKKQG